MISDIQCPADDRLVTVEGVPEPTGGTSWEIYGTTAKGDTQRLFVVSGTMPTQIYSWRDAAGLQWFSLDVAAPGHTGYAAHPVQVARPGLGHGCSQFDLAPKRQGSKRAAGERPPIRPGALDTPRTQQALLQRLDSYDLIAVGFSGGKDSIACVLRLLELGVPKSKLQLWHHTVDGRPDGIGAGVPDLPFADWPVTTAYVRRFAAEFDVPLRMSWISKGFLGELLLNNETQHPYVIQRQSGEYWSVGNLRPPVHTRRRWPAKSADHLIRWCSSTLKIQAAGRTFTHDPDLQRGKYLFVTGERRAESAVRARAAEWDFYYGNNQKRAVHHWCAVIDFTDDDVWQIIQRHGVRPHPAYELGWGRLSCFSCIYGGPEHWAGMRTIAPERFQLIAATEQQIGHTITHVTVTSVKELSTEAWKHKLEEQLCRTYGTLFPYVMSPVRQTQTGYAVSAGVPITVVAQQPVPLAKRLPAPHPEQAALIAVSQSAEYPWPIFNAPEHWQLPAGAKSGHGGGAD